MNEQNSAIHVNLESSSNRSNVLSDSALIISGENDGNGVNIAEIGENNHFQSSAVRSEEEVHFPSKFSQLSFYAYDFLKDKVTFTFAFFFSINLLIYLCYLLNLLDPDTFVLNEITFRYKKQYYRLLTHHFIHSNITHLVLNMSLFYYFSTQVEKKIGSLLLLTYTFFCLVFTSVFFMFYVKVFNLILFYIFNSRVTFDFYSAEGFSGVVLTIIHLHYLQSGLTLFISVMGISVVRGKNMIILYLVLIKILIPRTALFEQLAAIMTANLFHRVLKLFLFPRKEWLLDTETLFNDSVEKLKQSYFYIKMSEGDIGSIDTVVPLVDFDTLIRFVRNRGAERENENSIF